MRKIISDIIILIAAQFAILSPAVAAIYVKPGDPLYYSNGDYHPSGDYSYSRKDCRFEYSLLLRADNLVLSAQRRLDLAEDRYQHLVDGYARRLESYDRMIAVVESRMSRSGDSFYVSRCSQQISGYAAARYNLEVNSQTTLNRAEDRIHESAALLESAQFKQDLAEQEYRACINSRY